MVERDDPDRDEELMDEASPLESEDDGERRRLDADYLLDKVMPDEVDWRGLVRRHPFLSIGVAAGIGFLIGRAKGATIVAATSAAVTNAVMRQLSDVLEGEVFEF
jgi:hypothetical protein